MKEVLYIRRESHRLARWRPDCVDARARLVGQRPEKR